MVSFYADVESVQVCNIPYVIEVFLRLLISLTIIIICWMIYKLLGFPRKETQMVQGCAGLERTENRELKERHIGLDHNKKDEASVSSTEMDVTCKSDWLPKDVRLPNLILGSDLCSCDYFLPRGVVLVNFRDRDEFNKWTCKIIENNGIRITPLVDGELEIPLEYDNGNKKCVLHLTVNPDPWSLWQIKDPTDDMLVFPADKKRRDFDHHQNVIAYEDAYLQIVGASRRGRSHEHIGTFRDDDMGFWGDGKTGQYVFIVSDGAGSCKYSREGARLTIKFILEKLSANLTEADWGEEDQLLSGTGRVGMKLASLAHYAKEQLRKYVDEENNQHPEVRWELKDFSATILIAALKRGFDGSLKLVTFSIGDGAIAWKNGGKAQIMCSPDSGEFGGGTRFLTTPDVWKKIFSNGQVLAWSWDEFYKARVHHKFFTKEEVKDFSLYLMSDGVSDPWFETDAGLSDSRKWISFIEEQLMGKGDCDVVLSSKDEAKINAKRLLNWLNFRIAGNHDDRTLIAVFSTGAR